MPRPHVIAAAMILLFAGSSWASPPEGAVQRARELFQQAEAQYALTHYDEALASYEKAYEAKQLPGLLFNIGQCHRQLAHYDKAEHFYRTYLDQVPAAKNRPIVESLIEEMVRKQRELEAAKTPLVMVPVAPPPTNVLLQAPPPAAARTPLYKRWYVWTAVGAVVVGAGLGLGLGLGLHHVSLPAGSLSPVDARGAN